MHETFELDLTLFAFAYRWRASQNTDSAAEVKAYVRYPEMLKARNSLILALREIRSFRMVVNCSAESVKGW